MRTRQIGVVGVLLMGLYLASGIAMAHSGVDPLSLPAMQSLPANHPVTAQLLGLPLQFEANHGQVDDQVKFLARGKGYTLLLTQTESVMVLSRPEPKTSIDDRSAEFLMSLTFPPSQQETNTKMDDRTWVGPLWNTEPTPIKHSVVRMKLEGANPSPTIDGMEQLPGIVNYFIGNDPAKWRTKIPTFAKVHYKEAYPGIDLAYYGNQGKLEYDFIVAPGADPNQIKLAFEGASEITVADSGDLLLTTALGEVRVQKPTVYQLEQDGHKTLVAGNYVASTKILNSVQIQVANYDHEKPLVIDPVLFYSTYLGGSANEAGIEFGPQGIAVDSSGNACVAGATASTDFPGVTSGSVQSTNGGGSFDAYVAKVSSTGSSFLWTTYLGGTGYDRAAAIALDHLGNAYVTGLTASTTTSVATFPTTPGAFQTTGFPNKVFVSKISSDGSALMYSTLLGGASDRDIGWAIAVDGFGYAYVVGEARNTFPVTSGAFQTVPGDSTGNADVFVTKLNTTGTGLVYSTYVGGAGNDVGWGMAIDAAGNVYVTGQTNSTNFPGVTSGSILPTNGGGTFDAFAFKLNSSGTALDWSTYLGGSGDDIGRAIAVDSTGNAYATGQTTSPNFPVSTGSFQTTIGNPTVAGQYDAYVTKVGGLGNLVYSTYLGGNSYDGGWAIKVDGVGNAHVVGRGRSSNFQEIVPLTGSPIPSPAAFSFYSKVNPTGTGLSFSVYLGGTTARAGTSGDTEPLGLALDSQSNAYITGFTRSGNFPLVSAAQSTSGGTIDDFVMKIGDHPLADAGPDQSVSMGTVVTLDGTSSSGGSLTYNWTQVPGGPTVVLSGASAAHPTFTAPNVPVAGATVTFQLDVCEGTSSNCGDPDTVNVHIMNVNRPPVAEAGLDQTVQEGSPVLLNGSASYDPDVESITYTWLQVFGPTVTLGYPNSATPNFTAPPVGASGGQVDFELIVTDARGSNHADYVSVFISNVNQPPVSNAGLDQTRNENTLVTLDGSNSTDPDLDTLHFTWNQTGGLTVTLTGANTPSPTFTAPNVGPGGALLTFQLVVTDWQASGGADTVQVAIQDVNDPPVCSLAQPSVAVLWPPNHTMVEVSILGVTDPNNSAVTISYPRVTQDEPINGLGDGDTGPDTFESGNNILLRAERAGSGNGRVYAVQFRATDPDGASCTGTVKVSVPKSIKDTAVDSGQNYNSFGP